MKLSDIKVDTARAEAGEWVSDIPEMEDLRLKVRGTQCADARLMRNRILRGLPMNVRNDPDAVFFAMEKIEPQVQAEVILLDWENFGDVPYSKEKAAELLNDPDWVRLHDAVSWAANRVGRQLSAAKEREVGNSAGPSAGA